jgi:hypothetical protein
MATTIAHAPIVRVEEFGGARHIYCPSGAKLGQVDVIRGFAYYYGSKGSVHAGVTAIVRGGIDGLIKALAEGLRNGRDDRR